MEATHASFFSGVGGLDMGLERAGWHTVSFSEIDPYASAVLAQRWPGVPNLGDIVQLAGGERGGTGSGLGRDIIAGNEPDGWRAAILWTGGFPCQDLSVAGKRRGMVAGTRSNLAHAFLDLVERHRPPAVLLENVPGLLSSHAGRDLGALLGRLGELGYGWAYRVLDARHFGVPQRRRRVFILGIHARVDPSGQRAAEVLSVGSRCPGHPATGHQAGPGVADGAVPGVDRPGWGRISHAVTAGPSTRTGRLDPNGESFVISPSPDADRDGAPDGLAGRLDGGGGVAEPQFITENQRGEVGLSDFSFSLGQAGGKPGQGYAAVLTDTLRVGGRADGAGSSTDNTPWGDYPATPADDPLLPLGLDSHRYRCCGNGVVSDVSEWIGRRLMEAL